MSTIIVGLMMLSLLMTMAFFTGEDATSSHTPRREGYPTFLRLVDFT